MSKNGNTAVAPVLTPAEAVTRIAGQYPEEAKVLSGVLARDVRALGTDEVFALRDGQGQIRAFKQALTLSADNGGLIQPVYNGPWVVSAQGYEMMAEITGASVIFPKEVLVDGKWEPNPSVIRDSGNRRILAIYARAVAFRYSSKGIPQVVDRCTIFDTPSYRLIDLLGKAKKFPQAFRLLPSDMKRPEDNGTWAAYPFDESTTLWVNTAHEEALSWFAAILNREKKAIDFAQTFAARNALKHLFGIQKAPGPSWTFPVLCWRPTGQNIVKWDAAQYYALQDRVGGLSASCGSDFEPGKTLRLECKTGTERVSDETGFEGLERHDDPEDQTEIVEVASTGEAADEAPLTEEDLRTMKNYDEARDQFPVEHSQACKALGLPVDGDFTPKQAEAVIKKVGVILDAQNIA